MRKASSSWVSSSESSGAGATRWITAKTLSAYCSNFTRWSAWAQSSSASGWKWKRSARKARFSGVGARSTQIGAPGPASSRPPRRTAPFSNRSTRIRPSGPSPPRSVSPGATGQPGQRARRRATPRRTLRTPWTARYKGRRHAARQLSRARSLEEGHRPGAAPGPRHPGDDQGPRRRRRHGAAEGRAHHAGLSAQGDHRPRREGRPRGRRRAAGGDRLGRPGPVGARRDAVAAHTGREEHHPGGRREGRGGEEHGGREHGGLARHPRGEGGHPRRRHLRSVDPDPDRPLASGPPRATGRSSIRWSPTA